jgi:glucose-6-phosphate 1-dehydrogenase
MDAQTCDALVLFGVTGDLAAKMLLPAVDILAVERGLEIPVIGIARSDARGAPIAERVHDNIRRNGALDANAAGRVANRLRYVEGDLAEAATFDALRRVLAEAKRPLFYLAIPPSLFAGVAGRIAQAGLAQNARLAVEKPFGHDLASAHELESSLERSFAPEAILRIDHYLAKWPVRAIAQWRAANPWLEQAWSGAFVRSVQITMAESFGVEDRGRFYDAVGALRDVVQNHVLQVAAILAMELPDRSDGPSWQDARIAALAAIEPVSAENIVRGQYDGYRDIEGVAPDSQTETYIALRFSIDTPRWRGVPFCVRAGKRLPVTMTEAYSEYAPPGGSGSASHVRFALGPGRCDIGVAIGTMQKSEETPPELRVDLGHDDDCNAYVTLLAAALRGDTSYSERADGVFAAWRAVEPALRASLPIHVYAPGSWGPREADRVGPPGAGWHDPKMGSG